VRSAAAGLRTRRILVVVCGLASLWTALLLVTGGFLVHIGSLRISSQAPLPSLVVALAAGLAAWAISLTRGDAEPAASTPRERVRRVALLTLLILGLSVLALTQPAPPTDVNNCAFVNEMGQGMRHILNCDAVEYLALAHTPSMVLTPEHPYRQSRPLSFMVPYVVARPLQVFSWLNDHGIYPPYGPEFAAFALINLVVLVVTMLCFITLMRMARTGIPPGIELLFALIVLGANDVTKIFFWSPHSQIYNLFVPCVTMYVIIRMLGAGRALSVRNAVLLGAAIGTGLLMYGSFSVLLICACATQLLAYRKVVVPFLIGAAAVAIYAAWVVYVRLTAGFFYSYETEMFRQFIWLIDCYKTGADACVPLLQQNAWLTLDMLAKMTMVPLALIVAVRVARWVWTRDGNAAAPVNRHVGAAVAGSIVVAATLLLLMGRSYNMPRLFWVLIPPLLLVLVIELQQLRAALTVRGQRALAGIVFSAALVHLLIFALRQGPYQ